MNAQQKSAAYAASRGTPRLLAQAGYLVGLVKIDPPVLKQVGPKVVGELESDMRLLEEQEAAWKQAIFDARTRTQEQDEAVADATQWIRGFRRMYHAAILRGVKLMPLKVRPPTTNANVRSVAAKVRQCLGVGRKHASALASFGITAEYLKEGHELADRLPASDQTQEVDRSGAVTNERLKVLAVKARVYGMVKQIVAIALTLHAKERLKRRQYLLRLMNRRGTLHPSAPQVPPVAAAG